MPSDASSSQWNAPDGLRSRLHEAGDSRAPALSFARAPNFRRAGQYPGRDHALPTLLFEEFSLMQVAGLFLNPRAARHPCWLLDALFRCTAASLLELAAGPHRVRATPAFGLLLNGPGFGEGSDMGRGIKPKLSRQAPAGKKLLEMALPIAPRHYQVTGFSSDGFDDRLCCQTLATQSFAERLRDRKVTQRL